METALMSESLVDTCDVEETVTQVLTQLVQDGDKDTYVDLIIRIKSFRLVF